MRSATRKKEQPHRNRYIDKLDLSDEGDVNRLFKHTVIVTVRKALF